jgi:hypothetical protein
MSASAISAGPADEAAQTLSFIVTNTNNALFSVQPAVSPTGTLTFTPSGLGGTATVSVSLQDNGGTANGGSDTSAVHTFTIIVLSTNVSTTADSGPGSLREAIAHAALIPGPDTLTFSPGLSGQTITLSSEIVINDADGLTIDASAVTGGVTVDGGTGTNRIFSISSGASLTLTSLTLTGGNGAGTASTGNGGAIYNLGTLTATNCTFFSNTATGNGGAVAHGGGSGSAAATYTRCTFSDNTSYAATQGGGAINHASGALSCVLTHCTLTGNNTSGGASSSGGGLRNRGSGLTLNYCLIAGNLCAGGTGPDVSSTVAYTLGGANLIQTAVVGGGSGTGPAPITAAPLLAPLGNYGGPTQTMALLPGSPARNAATGSTASTDQRGFLIVGTADIGAYEAGTATNFNAWIYETLPANATVPQHAATFDFDGDGVTNENEWPARTDPGDAASYFRIIQSAINGTNFSLTFPTVLGRSYQLQSSANLANPWTSIGSPTAGTGGNMTVPVDVTGHTKHFFRVAVGAP